MTQVCEALPDIKLDCLLFQIEAFCAEDELTQARLKLYFLKKRNNQLYLWDQAYYNFMYFRQLNTYGYYIEKAMELGYFNMAKFAKVIKKYIADVKDVQAKILNGEKVYFCDRYFTKPQIMDGLHCNKKLILKSLPSGTCNFRCKVCAAEFKSNQPEIVYYTVEDLIKNSK